MKRFSFKPGLTLKGREFKGAKGFAGKPFHPPLTDIPIGAYVIAPLLDVLSFVFKARPWSHGLHQAAGYVLLVGFAFSILTALTGFLDWLDTEKGTQMRRMANSHAWTMIAMTLLVAGNLAYRYLIHPENQAGLVVVALGAAILLLAVIGGTIGGSMVYDWGFNVVMSKDSPAWHKSDTDVVHPSDAPPDEEESKRIHIPDLQGKDG